jgi:hypothetical protein
MAPGAKLIAAFNLIGIRVVRMHLKRALPHADLAGDAAIGIALDLEFGIKKALSHT